MAKAEYRSAIRSRKLIMGALADLLQEKPLDKITVTDIVNRAQINRGTFYAHYSDISDVLNHLIQQTFSKIQDAIVASPQPISAVPHAILSKIQLILEEDLEFYQKIMNSSASSIVYDQLVGVVLEYLLARQEDFGFSDSQQYALTLRFFAGGVSNLYRDWFSGKLPISLDELTQQVESLLSSILPNIQGTSQPLQPSSLCDHVTEKSRKRGYNKNK